MMMTMCLEVLYTSQTSPGPVEEPEDQNPGPNNHESGPSRTIFSNVSREANEERPRSPLGIGTLLQRFSPFLRGLGTEKKTAVREDKANVKCY